MQVWGCREEDVPTGADRGRGMAEMSRSAAKGQLRRQLLLGHCEDRRAAISEPSTWCTRPHLRLLPRPQASFPHTRGGGAVGGGGSLPCAWPLSGCSPYPSELTETLPASHYKLSDTPLNNNSQGLSPGCQPRWVGCVWLLMTVRALYTGETEERTRCITGWITRSPEKWFSHCFSCYKCIQ